MNYKFWSKTREGSLAENRIMRTAVAIQTFVIVVLAIGLVNKNTTVVLVPPTLDERSEISASGSSPETQTAWGMYLAGLMGNVTPTSSKALKEMISPHLTSKLWGNTRDALDAQVREIQQAQLTLSFAPTIARFDPDSKKVIVTGELVIRGLRGQEKRELRTYEMGFVTKNYRVMLDSLRVMKGKFAEEAANTVADKAATAVAAPEET